jgi:putative flippase GtrA
MTPTPDEGGRVRLRDTVFPLAGQFGRFALVGGTNASISLCVDAALLSTGLASSLAAAAAFAAGALNGYVLNRRWTFAAADSLRARLSYSLVQIGGLASTVGLVSAIDRMAEPGHFTAYIAAAPPVTLAMFFANRVWTFAPALSVRRTQGPRVGRPGAGEAATPGTVSAQE